MRWIYSILQAWCTEDHNGKESFLLDGWSGRFHCPSVLRKGSQDVVWGISYKHGFTMSAPGSISNGKQRVDVEEEIQILIQQSVLSQILNLSDWAINLSLAVVCQKQSWDTKVCCDLAVAQSSKNILKHRQVWWSHTIHLGTLNLIKLFFNKNGSRFSKVLAQASLSLTPLILLSCTLQTLF